MAIVERSVKDERGGRTRWTEALLRMKSESEVSDDFEAHFARNAGHYLDPRTGGGDRARLGQLAVASSRRSALPIRT